MTFKDGRPCIQNQILNMNHRPAKSKIFNPNPTRKKFLISETRPEIEKKFFKPKPDPEKKNFQAQTRPELEKIFIFNPNLKNVYVTVLGLNIFKIAYNIRISIGYKDNFRQVFGMNQVFFKTCI